MTDLAKAVERLALARETEAHEKEALAAVEAVIAEKFGDALTKARRCLQFARADEVDASVNLRQLTLDEFYQGDKATPHPAASIIMQTILYYDDGDAISYCRKHLPKALSLRKRDFEKAAKVIEPDFVKIRQEPRVRIKHDLSEWLPAEGDDA